jgi:hypothetical protein
MGFISPEMLEYYSQTVLWLKHRIVQRLRHGTGFVGNLLKLEM